MKRTTVGGLARIRPHLSDFLWAMTFLFLFARSFAAAPQFNHLLGFVVLTAAIVACMLMPISVSVTSQLVAFNVMMAPVIVGFFYFPAWQLSLAILIANLVTIIQLRSHLHLLYVNTIISGLLVLVAYLLIGNHPLHEFNINTALLSIAAMVVASVANSLFWTLSIYSHNTESLKDFTTLVPLFTLFNGIELLIGLVSIALLVYSPIALAGFLALLVCVYFVCNAHTAASTERAWLNLLFSLSRREIDDTEPLAELHKIVEEARTLLRNEDLRLVDSVTENESFCEYLGIISGRPWWLQCSKRGSIKLVQQKNRDFITTLALSIQNTFAKAAEHSILEEAAYRDSLTGLPNRRMVLDMVERRIRDAVTAKREGALLFMDLNGFKQVNDTYGHETGDIILQEVAFRLSECFRGDDAVGRLAGDEFVVVIESLNDGHSVSDIVERIERALEPPVELANATLRLSASIGVAVFPRDGDNLRDLLHAADTAMYNAKKAGQGWALFS